VGIVRQYYGISFPDEQNGWVVGAQGVILHTNNGGATWSRQQSPVDAMLNCVYFMDAGHGWISGANGAALVYIGFQPTFLDVNSSHPNFDAIEALARREVIGGYAVAGGLEFRPSNPIWRAQFAKMIVGGMGLTVSEETWNDADPPFSDLGADDAASLYPHDFIAAAVNNNITRGVAAGLFAPYQDITRAQVVTMVVRASQALNPGQLREVPAGWQGVLPPMSSPDHAANMRIAEYNGLLEGLSGLGAAWDPWAKATRAEVAQILWNLKLLTPATPAGS
jgi:hypothetical protein